MEALAFHGDLNLNGEFADCVLLLDSGCLILTENGVQRFRLPAGQLTDIALTPNVGCGCIHCKKDGEPFALSRCTTALMPLAGEFVKALAYYLETGEAIPVSPQQETKCPKCGRPYLEGSATCMYCVKKSDILLRAVGLMRPFLKKMSLACLVLALSNLLYISLPVLNRILIDDYLQTKSGTVLNILLICGAILLMRASGEVLFIFSARSINSAGSYFANRLRHMAYDKVQQLSMGNMSRKTTGDLLKRITQDTQKVREFLIDQGRWLFEMVIQFLAVGIIMFATQPMLALLVLVPVPLAFWISLKVWDRIMLKYDRQWRLFAKSNSILHDIIKGIRVVKSFGNEKREVEKFSRSCEELAQVSMKNEQLYALIFPLLGFLVGIGEFFVLYFGGQMVLGRALTLGELVQFTMFIGLIYAPLRWMTSLPRWLADVMTSLLKIYEVLDEQPEVCPPALPQDTKIKGEIQFDRVTFGYKAYEPVLKDISFTIHPGEMIGIVGPSGTGKSTLINLVMRLYDVNSGRLLIDGVDIRQLSPETLHKALGVVFQENFLFAGTIYENLRYSRPGAAYEEVISAAKTANAHEFIMKLPDAYQTVVGENGYTLSGGERQRVAIARALLRDPSILILDEATASLDVETESRVQEALGNLVKGRTTIAIAHRLSTLKNAHRLLVLENGRIAEFGTHAQLLAAKGVYYRLVMAQLRTQGVKE